MIKSKYIIASYKAKPRDKSLTHIKGYMSEDNNVQYDEQLTFAVRLKKKDMVEASVILDLLNEKVIKNRMSDENFYVMLDYFLKNYKHQIDEFLKD